MAPRKKKERTCDNLDMSDDNAFAALFNHIDKNASIDCPAILSPDEADQWKYTGFDDTNGNPCLALEWLFGCKGLLSGRILKFDAMEGTGKSSLMLALMGMAQRSHNAVCQQYETERAPMPPDRIAGLRCNPARLIIRQPNGIDACLSDAESCVGVIREKVNNDTPIIIGIDSVSNIGETKCDLDTGENESGGAVAIISRKFSSFFRNKLNFFKENNVILIATAQLKDNIVTGPAALGAPAHTTIAANTFKYMASWIVEMRECASKQFPDDKNAVDVRLRVTKNKLASKGREIYVTLFRDNRGWDFGRAHKELLFGPSSPMPGAFKASGGWYSHPDINGGGNMRWDEFYDEFLHNDDLIMQCREALQIRGFGFDFEKQFVVE